MHRSKSRRVRGLSLVLLIALPACSSNTSGPGSWAPYPVVYAIGDTGPGGGIVFYDAGSLQSWGRYLEAAPVMWNNGTDDPLTNWGCSGTSISGALGTDIGAGAANTAAIVADCAESEIAAQLADALTFGGKSDWFLPSKDELNVMYLNLGSKGVGDFAPTSYWSSSEDRADYAWYYYFGNGNQGRNVKDYTAYVRPVRAFG